MKNWEKIEKNEKKQKGLKIDQLKKKEKLKYI